MAETFNDIFIKSLKPEDREYTRQEKGGFGVRVYPTGRKTFYYAYRVDGQRRFLNLGEYYNPAKKGEAKGDRLTLKEARDSYDSEQQKVKDLKNGRPTGKDPVMEIKQEKEKRQQEKADHLLFPTVSELVTEYIERHAKVKKRSWAKDEAILNRDVIPAWGKRKAKDITKRDVNLLLESIVDRGAPIMANNCFAVIRKMFNYAVEKDILQSTPCAGVKMPSEKKARERVLAESEIKTFWDNLPGCAITPDLQRALKLILLTGQRPGEVSGMHADEINGSWWTIPVERSKNKRAHRVYLTATALELIGATTGKGYIFPTPYRGVERPVGDTALAVAVGRNLKFPVTDDKGQPLYTKDGKQATVNRIGVDQFTPHDLRRTAATFMSQLGEHDEVIDAILNHAKKGIIATYNLNRYDREKQQALESWERKLQAIITGKGKDNVVSIGTAKGIKAA